MKTTTIVLLACFTGCGQPPSTLPDALEHSLIPVSIRVDGRLSGEALQVFDWTPDRDTEFVTLCSSHTPVALSIQDVPLRILAVQDDGCIEPEDSALEDIILYADTQYRLSVPTHSDVVFIMMLLCDQSK